MVELYAQESLWRRQVRTALSGIVAGVSSVFGRTGAVVAANGDYTAGQVTNVPAGGISAVTVQAALNELDSEKQAALLLGALNYIRMNAGNTAPEGRTPEQVTTDIMFRQTGSNTVLRTANAKMADRVDYRDFDGATADVKAQRAIDSLTSGGEVYFPPGEIQFAAPVTLNAFVELVGAAGAPGYGGSTTRLFRNFDGAALINVPGSATVSGTPFVTGQGLGWGLRNIGLDGNDKNYPIVNMTEVVPGRGSFFAQMVRVGFYRGRPAIYAECSWDIFITLCAFKACGNMATGTGTDRATIWIYNGNNTYPGANSNCWIIVNNFFDAVSGIGIVSDMSGAGQRNIMMEISGNHHGPRGYKFIHGAFDSSLIRGNRSEGIDAGLTVAGSIANDTTIDLTSGTGTGRNKVIHNELWTPGDYHIRTANYLDDISDNMLLVEGSSGYYIHFTSTSALCKASNNKTNDAGGGFNGFPLVNDEGSENTVAFGNDGSQETVSGNAYPLKWRGTSYQMLAMSGSEALPYWNGTSFSKFENPIKTPNGRLTLTTGVPVLASTVTGAGTIYYTPYVGMQTPIYDGTRFVNTGHGEISQALSDTTKSPAAATTDSNYDLFVWNDSGTVRCTRGPAWTSATARGTGAGTSELSRLFGTWTNAQAITNGPAANRGTYVGTIRTNGSSTVDFTMAALAAGGTAGFVGLWNAYNRVPVAMSAQDSTDTWAYTTATWRSANNSAGMRVSFINGLAEGVRQATYRSCAHNTSGIQHAIGIGYDATNAIAAGSLTSVDGATTFGSLTANYAANAGLGFHFLQAIEFSYASGTTNWYGDNGVPTDNATGLHYIGDY